MRKERSIPRPSPLMIIGGVIVIAVVAFIIAGPTVSNLPQEQVTYNIPYTVKTIFNENIKLSNYQGKNVIFYFTGASCDPCKAQLPYIIDSYNTYKSTGKIEVFSFDIQGKTVGELTTWKNENGITWKVCQDTGATMSSHFSIYSIPTLVICDKNGNEINRYVGAQSESTIQAIFASMVS